MMPSKLLSRRNPTCFILLSLSTEKMHGYAILKEVEALSKGKVRLSNGALYGALIRLQDRGWIERVASGEPHTSCNPRIAYRITRTGLAVLQAELAQLGALMHPALDSGLFSQSLPLAFWSVQGHWVGSRGSWAGVLNRCT